MHIDPVVNVQVVPQALEVGTVANTRSVAIRRRDSVHRGNGDARASLTEPAALEFYHAVDFT